MEQLQFNFGVCEQVSHRRDGRTRLPDGRFATVAQIGQHKQKQQADAVIAQYRYNRAIAQTLRAMAEKIIQLENQLKKLNYEQSS